MQIGRRTTAIINAFRPRRRAGTTVVAVGALVAALLALPGIAVAQPGNGSGPWGSLCYTHVQQTSGTYTWFCKPESWKDTDVQFRIDTTHQGLHVSKVKITWIGPPGQDVHISPRSVWVIHSRASFGGFDNGTYHCKFETLRNLCTQTKTINRGDLDFLWEGGGYVGIGGTAANLRYHSMTWNRNP